jgi:hypothetical protein
MRLLVVALSGLAVAAGTAVAAPTGQSPDCRRFCMSVEPRSGPEGSVFRIEGRRWRPERRVTVYFGPYCRPDEACPAIAYIGRLRTNERGRFTFKLRAGTERAGDVERRIVSGGRPLFTQQVGDREVSRAPRYRVTIPPPS